ncbi:uncharacterized protein [Halyomorpha halys]|uniref:uncharacterized protein n=1 Tax=Halyomorpha halys TaxID=286706 RepID=UPI0006D5296E|nr:uncharacterized protein LOC106678799 [Halyomorpha halys]
MKTTLGFQLYFTAIFVIFENPAFCIPLHFNSLNKQTPSEEAWNLPTSTSSHNLKEVTSARNGVYQFCEPQLITFLFKKLLTRTHDWKEHMKHVADSFVSSYFNPGSSSAGSKSTKTGREAATQAPHFIPESYKLGKKNHKRNANKPSPHEEEIKKPLNFSPVVQFIPASLDLSNKIMFYQPQLIINGSVYIEQNKDPKPMWVQEMFDFNRNRNNITNV